MSTPFIGEVKIMAFNFAPKGWAMCNGQLLAIGQNQALFSLLGTSYGGDGRVTFALPDLRGKIPMHVGPAFSLGQTSGEEAHTLTTPELPAHTHWVSAAGSGTAADPSGQVWANGGSTAYASTPNTNMKPAAIGVTGGSQPHENRPPYLTLTFCIALTGIFPSRS